MALVVFAGQSNALGYGMDRSTLPEGGALNLGSTFIWNNDSRNWEIMQPGVNTGTEANPQAWGPEVAFAEDFRSAHPYEALYVVKSAKGSTGLARDDDANDWSPDSRGEMFDLTTERVAAARAALGGASVDEVFLFQGEQDATNPAAAAAYGDNLQDWLAALRDRWMHDPQGEVAFGRVGDTTPYADEVRAAQYAIDIEDPHAVSFDTAGLSLQADLLHYAADGVLKIGASFYSAYADWS